MYTAPAFTAQRPPPRWPQPGVKGPAQDTADERARRCLIRLLVVDDDLGSIEYLGQLLKGFALISFATNGEDGLRLAARQPPDLVLLDIQLPGLDGFEICRRMRALPGLQDLPVIFASQYADADVEARALQLGAEDFLHKPFDETQLLTRLRSRLRAMAATPAATDPASRAGRRATASMLSFVAHEIGNPVNVIKGFAELMQAEPLSRGQADKLAHILEAVQHLHGLLADVGDVARMGSGQFHVEAGEVDLGAVVQQACGPAREQAGRAGMHLSVPTLAAPLRVKADGRRLRQCLDNLLSNAVKYGREGGCIEVEIEARSGVVTLAVQDHGAGLSETQLSHLFEPYNRLGRDGGSIPGTGLGLTLTRELMRAMGGRLQVSSGGLGLGCRFELILQAADG